jgi:hypothetical protein
MGMRASSLHTTVTGAAIPRLRETSRSDALQEGSVSGRACRARARTASAPPSRRARNRPAPTIHRYTSRLLGSGTGRANRRGSPAGVTEAGAPCRAWGARASCSFWRGSSGNATRPSALGPRSGTGAAVAGSANGTRQGIVADSNGSTSNPASPRVHTRCRAAADARRRSSETPRTSARRADPLTVQPASAAHSVSMVIA